MPRLDTSGFLLYASVVIADLEPPKTMPPNLGRGYRTPFTKETAAAYGRKGGLTRGKQLAALAQFGRDLKGQTEAKLSANFTELQPKLNSLRRMQRRFMAQAVAENDAKKQALFMRSFQIAFDAEQTLLGNTKSKKPSRSKLSPHDLPMPDPVSCGMAPESGNQGVNPANAQPATGQATSAIPPDSASDCPF